jgi:hypothetical protein
MDDLDKLPSFDAGATPRRSTSSLGNGASPGINFKKQHRTYRLVACRGRLNNACRSLGVLGFDSRSHYLAEGSAGRSSSNCSYGVHGWI